MATQLPSEPGPHILNLEEHLPALFEMDKVIFNIPPLSFPFDEPEQLLKQLTEDHTSTTIIWNNEDGKSVGYFSYDENLDVPDTVELINIGTLPEYQGRGYGKKMMKHYLDIIKGKNSRLVTHPQNTRSRKLYESVGYTPVKVLENYFGDGQPRLLYFRRAQM